MLFSLVAILAAVMIRQATRREMRGAFFTILDERFEQVVEPHVFLSHKDLSKIY
jgi:hypothetical protein